VGVYLPPGWPASVPAPDAGGWEEAASGWLFDVLAPDYRPEPVLREYPAALVFVARQHIDACLTGARDGYRVVRTELGEKLPPHTVDAVLAAYREEGHRLHAIAHGVDLIGRAIRGEVFSPKK
jgi:hypothetical protein